MGDYYLISQLPSLDGIGDTTPLPIREEQFWELCRRFLKPMALRHLEELSAVPDAEADPSRCAFARAWNGGERALRLALATQRAARQGKSFDGAGRDLPAEAVKAAAAAVEIDNPLEAERFLLSHRLDFLETLRPMDPFSEDYLCYYRVKLMLLERMRRFDRTLGEQTYHEIYNSILNGDRLGA